MIKRMVDFGKLNEKKREKAILFTFFTILSLFFTLWFAIPFSISRSQDARMARAFITDEAELCEIINKSINENKSFMFDAYGFVYYKSGISILKGIKKIHAVDEQTVLIFFRLYSWLHFLGFCFIMTLFTYQLIGFYGAFFVSLLSFISTPVLLLYAVMLHPDVAQVFYIALSLWLLFNFVKSGRIVFILVSSIAAGLAFSSKYAGFLILPSIFLVILAAETRTNALLKNKYAINLISIILLVLTIYLFDSNKIAQYLTVSNLEHEILFYIKIVRYLGILVLVLLIVNALFIRKLKDFKLAKRLEIILVLALSSSWLFLSAYLLTVRNLLNEYKFLSSFLNVTGFHAVGHNFVQEGGLINWLRVMLGNEVFGASLLILFLFSIVFISLNFSKLRCELKLTFLLLALWQFLFAMSIIFRVKSMWEHYLLPMVPVLILFISILFTQIFRIKSKAIKYALLLIILGVVTERSIIATNYCLERKNDEATSNSVKAGKWLQKNADYNSFISANNYCYVPNVFNNVVFNWGTNLEDLYNPQIDYILTHTSVIDDYADKLVADKFVYGKDTYLKRHQMRKLLLENNNIRFKLVKDVGEIKIFKRNVIPDKDTLDFYVCTFDTISAINWSVDSSGLDNDLCLKKNTVWHFKKENTWGPAFNLKLADAPANSEYLIEMKLKLYSNQKTLDVLIISQLSENGQIKNWQKTEINKEGYQANTWIDVYANFIVTKELENRDRLSFSTYLWNWNHNDFCIDNFEIIFSRL